MVITVIGTHSFRARGAAKTVFANTLPVKAKTIARTIRRARLFFDLLAHGAHSVHFNV